MAEALDVWVRRLAAGQVRSTMAHGLPAWDDSACRPTRAGQRTDTERLELAMAQGERGALCDADAFAARDYLRTRFPQVDAGSASYGLARVAALCARADVPGLRALLAEGLARKARTPGLTGWDRVIAYCHAALAELGRAGGAVPAAGLLRAGGVAPRDTQAAP